jgi:hypothetical protein
VPSSRCMMISPGEWQLSRRMSRTRARRSVQVSRRLPCHNPGEEGHLTVTGRQPALQVRQREGPDGTDPELIVRVREVGLPTVSMQVEIWVSSPEPAVGVCTPAGTWQGRFQRHFVIGYADPCQNPVCRWIRQLSGSGEGSEQDTARSRRLTKARER